MPNTPQANPTLPTVAEAFATIAAADLSEHRRKTMRSALRALLRLEAKPAEAVRLDPKRSLTLLEQAAPATLRISPGTLTNFRTALRQIFRMLGLLGPARVKPGTVTDPNWTALIENLPAGHDFKRLLAFAAYCASEHIAPTAVTQAALDTYADLRAAERGGGKSRDRARRVANQWNRASSTIAGWPAIRLGVTGDVRQLSLPFDAYPQPLQQDIEAYLGELAAPGSKALFGGDGRRPLRPATIAIRRDTLRRLLMGAVHSGIAPEMIRDLRTIVTKEFFEPALQWHFERAGEAVTADLAQMASTIISVGLHLKLPASELDELKQQLKGVSFERPPELIEKHLEILNALDDPATHARLLHLPTHLLREATRLRDGWTDRRGVYHQPRPLDAAWQAGLAVAIEIALHAPLRISNLHALRLGKELRLIAGARGKWRASILIDAAATKTGRRIEFPVSPETTAIIREYLEDFRPALPRASSDWLFPGIGKHDGPRNKSALGVSIAEITHQFTGVRINPHAFRSIAASHVLACDPHAIDDVRAMLGHQSFTTALTFYRRSNQIAAADRLSQHLKRQRRNTQLIATAQDKQLLGLPPRSKH